MIDSFNDPEANPRDTIDFVVESNKIPPVVFNDEETSVVQGKVKHFLILLLIFIVFVLREGL